MVQLGPGLARADQGRGEDHCVEGNVVLSHKLVELDIVGVLPPLLPLVGVVSGDRDVSDRGIEPHVEHFRSEFLQRHLGSPLEITGDASTKKALLKHGLGEAD